MVLEPTFHKIGGGPGGLGLGAERVFAAPLKSMASLVFEIGE
jgi:hypothetical protein